MEINDFIKKLADSIEIENASNLNENTIFRNLPEWSSLSVMLLIAFYDEEFGIEVGDKEIKNCQCIKDLYNLTQR